MYTFRRLVILFSLTTMGFATGPRSALAVVWTPAGAEVATNSTDVSFEVGNSDIICQSTAADSEITKESSTWSVAPTFRSCSSQTKAGFQIKAGSAWTVTAVNNEEATLTIPKGEASGVAIEASPKCKVLIDEGSTLGSAGDFENDENGVTNPSELTITEQKVPVVDSPKECLNSATQAKVSAHFLFLNFTNENEAIEIGGKFEAKGQWKGPVKIIKSGEFVDEGASVKCPEKEIEATWTIQSKGVINEHETEGKQAQVKEGPNLNIDVIKWGSHCTATIAAEKFEAKIKPCELQARLFSGRLKATGGVVTTCVIEANPCKITVPGGSETTPESNTGTNVGLEEISLENKKENLLFKVTTKGITAEIAKGTLCPLKTNKTSELKGIEGEAEGVNSV